MNKWYPESHHMISIEASAVISNASFPTMSAKYGLSISKAVCLISFGTSIRADDLARCVSPDVARFRSDRHLAAASALG